MKFTFALHVLNWRNFTIHRTPIKLTDRIPRSDNPSSPTSIEDEWEAFVTLSGGFC